MCKNTHHKNLLKKCKNYITYHVLLSDYHIYYQCDTYYYCYQHVLLAHTIIMEILLNIFHKTLKERYF